MSLGAKHPGLSVFSSLTDLLDALPSDPVAEQMMKEGIPAISQDVMQVLWKLFFGTGDLGGGDAKKRALIVVGMCGTLPIMGWNFKNTDVASVLSMFAVTIQTLSEHKNVDLMTPLAKMLMEMLAKAKQEGMDLKDIMSDVAEEPKH
jgi:hypothetical protein